ncbi:MAG: ROK family protein [Vicinamibacterales bacterium]
MDVLVIDIGGSRVKLFSSDAEERQTLVSGPSLRPTELVEQVQGLTAGWSYDVISIGYPGSTGPEGPSGDAGNLGEGWIGFDFESAFGHPVRIVNDAAMQALGSYEGGRMLFLGLGTGLGSTFIAERVIIPLELGCLEHRSGHTLAERLGKEGLATLGKEAWTHTLHDAVAQLHKSFAADYVVIGGGNAELVDPLPPGARRGGNDAAFTGGFRLWDEMLEPHDTPPSHVWRVVW